jgi:hypothetical protein
MMRREAIANERRREQQFLYLEKIPVNVQSKIKLKKKILRAFLSKLYFQKQEQHTSTVLFKS